MRFGPPPPKDVLDSDFLPAFKLATQVLLPVTKVAWEVWFGEGSWTEVVWAPTRNRARIKAVQLGYEWDGTYLAARARRAPWADSLENASELELQTIKWQAFWCWDATAGNCEACGRFPFPLVTGSQLNDRLCAWCHNNRAESRQAFITVLAIRQAHLNK
jgi:hypothetical protein